MPHEVWFDTPVDYFSFHIFGCSAYAYVNEGKLEPRSKKCIFLGYASGVKGYRLWCTNPKFIVSRDVIFYESSMLNQKKEVVDAGIEHCIKKQVELEFYVSKKIQESTSIQSEEDKEQHSSEEVV